MHEKRAILSMLLVLSLILVGIPELQYPVMAASIELKGTDIYNGLRGQSFNEGWKFYKGDVNNGQSINYDDSNWSDVTLPSRLSIFNSFNQRSPRRRWRLPGRRNRMVQKNLYRTFRLFRQESFYTIRRSLYEQPGYG